MKTFAKASSFLVAAATLPTASSLHAATITKAGSGSSTELTDNTAWAGSIAPGTGDAATWDATSDAGTQNLVSPVIWNTMVTTNLASALTLTGSAITFSLNSNAAAITTGTQAINIGNDIILSSGGASSVVVGAGSTAPNRVQISVGSGGATFGTITANGTATANDANVMFRGTGAATVNGTLTVDGQLYKGDTGSLTLNGANSIGWVYANNGTLLAGNNQAFGTGSIYVASGGGGSVTIASKDATALNLGNTLDMTLAGSTIASIGQSSGGTGALTFGALNVGTVNAKIQTNVATSFSSVTGTTGGITKSGTGTLTLSGANIYTGGTTISAGTITLGNAAALGTGALTITATGQNIVNTVPLTGAVTISNAIALNNTGDTGFQMLGGSGNSVNLSGNITGTTSRLFLNNSASGDGAAFFTLSGNNTFTTTTSIYVNRGSLRIGSATALGASSNTLHYDSNAGTLSFAGSYSIANNINFTWAAQNLDTEANTVTLSGVIGGNQNLTKIGSGTLVFSGANTYSGTTTVSAGTLQINDGGSLSTGGITVNTALQYNRSTATTVNNTLTLGGNMSLKSMGAGAVNFTSNLSTINFTSSRTLTLGGASVADNTFSGIIGNATTGGGSVHVTKVDAGKWILTGANTYTGITAINAGTLVAGHLSALGSGAVTVNGGTLQVGSGITLTSLTSLTLSSGATLSFVTSAESLASSGITLNNGTYNLASGSLLDVTAFTSAGTYHLITGASGPGTAASGFSNQLGGFAYQLTALSSGVDLLVTAVPEPSTYGLLGAGALAGVALVRRRRKKTDTAA